MNKTALITGASSGIGASFAKELARDNWSIIIHGRREELLNKLSISLKELGAREVTMQSLGI
jgi:short-subunit dehydrogenase